MSLAREVELLFQAAAEPIGIIVNEPENLELLRQRLYRARKEQPQFSNIAILTSPTAPETELWLINQEPKP